MIVTVTPNAALDLTWHADRIEHGSTHRVGTGVARAGGKGLNVARVAHAQGAAVRAVAAVGGATGAEFAQELDASGVPHRLISVQGATRRSIALVDEHRGDTTILNERGVNPTPAEWEALTAAVLEALDDDSEPTPASVPPAPKRAEQAGESAASATDPRPAILDRNRVLVVSGSLPPGAPPEVLHALIRAGRDRGARVIADTSGPALLAAAASGAQVLKPNAAELAEATGIADPVAGACELLRLGASLVLVSRGADGMLAVTSDEVVRARPATRLAGNPTGAGDAAVAACAVLLATGETDLRTVLRRATAWSAAAVLMPLAGEINPSWPELESALVVDCPSLSALH